ncbi:Chagasin family peptidase inhibitor I42 [Nonomuraea jiangxiensis]|uniref:Chagasin family peptidase inhibitor I42 n=2 Tax=Nonomuraea jiangxiensis TaxID=633440 RepID=A0A1G8D195_9ACTN|nr:Chagasin family peptidase inhibitor I42 [Nonomuraea jiangxiensis]
MRRTAVVALLALLLSGCSGGAAVSDFGTVIKGAKGTTVQVQVRAGQRFSLAVAENPSVGDAWDLPALPDTKIASFISAEREAHGDAPGTGGTAYFVFHAKLPGSTEIRLRDCWRCGPDKVPPDEESRRQSGEAIFAITVGPAR